MNSISRFTQKPELKRWLEEHTHEIQTAKTLRLYNFRINWKTMDGSCTLELDNPEIPIKVSLSLQADARLATHFPMHHSPLGIPASFPSVVVSQEIASAIAKAIHENFPRLRGTGLHKDIGREITIGSPLSVRVINQQEFEIARDRISKKGFEIVTKISG
jgi:hypothetical protein